MEIADKHQLNALEAFEANYNEQLAGAIAGFDADNNAILGRAYPADFVIAAALREFAIRSRHIGVSPVVTSLRGDLESGAFAPTSTCPLVNAISVYRGIAAGRFLRRFGKKR